MSLTGPDKLGWGLRTRLTIVYSTLFGLFLCLFAFILTGQSLDSSRKDFVAALLNYGIDLTSAVDIDPSGLRLALHMHKAELRKHFPFTLRQTFYAIRNIRGDIIGRSEPGIPEIPYVGALAEKKDYTHRFQNMEFNHQPYRAVNIKFTSAKNDAFIVQVATPSSILVEQKERYLLMNALVIPLIVLIASLTAFYIAGKSLEPINELTRTANNIAARNLSLRVPEIPARDELGELSRTLNNLLERLELAFKAQENFVANASHQLNTPLAIIKGELDVLETKGRNPEEVAKFHRSLKEEVERLTALVKHLLLISRVESGHESFIFHPVRLDELLLSISSRLTPKAKQKQISFRFDIDASSSDVSIHGVRQLLDCLFENLLDNAIKYAPENSSVGILIQESDEGPQVLIRDEGPGIRREELLKILSQRFQRGSKGLIPGTGIGLSIAHQIAEFHQARIDYQEREPRGSQFTVTFPK